MPRKIYFISTATFVFALTLGLSLAWGSMSFGERLLGQVPNPYNPGNPACFFNDHFLCQWKLEEFGEAALRGAGTNSRGLPPNCFTSECSPSDFSCRYREKPECCTEDFECNPYMLAQNMLDICRFKRVCNQDSHRCEEKPGAEDGTACDDKNKCTGSDQCDGLGNCSGTPVECEEGKQCNDKTGACDEIPCYGKEQCIDGRCVDNLADCDPCPDQEHCDDGRCVDSLDECEPCEIDQVLCDDGTCADFQDDCPKPDEESEDEEMKDDEKSQENRPSQDEEKCEGGRVKVNGNCECPDGTEDFGFEGCITKNCDERGGDETDEDGICNDRDPCPDYPGIYCNEYPDESEGFPEEEFPDDSDGGDDGGNTAGATGGGQEQGNTGGKGMGVGISTGLGTSGQNDGNDGGKGGGSTTTGGGSGGDQGQGNNGGTGVPVGSHSGGGMPSQDGGGAPGGPTAPLPMGGSPLQRGRDVVMDDWESESTEPTDPCTDPRFMKQTIEELCKNPQDIACVWMKFCMQQLVSQYADTSPVSGPIVPLASSMPRAVMEPSVPPLPSMDLPQESDLPMALFNALPPPPFTAPAPVPTNPQQQVTASAPEVPHAAAPAQADGIPAPMLIGEDGNMILARPIKQEPVMPVSTQVARQRSAIPPLVFPAAPIEEPATMVQMQDEILEEELPIDALTEPQPALQQDAPITVAEVVKARPDVFTGEREVKKAKMYVEEKICGDKETVVLSDLPFFMCLDPEESAGLQGSLTSTVPSRGSQSLIVLVAMLGGGVWYLRKKRGTKHR